MVVNDTQVLTLNELIIEHGQQMLNKQAND